MNASAVMTMMRASAVIGAGPFGCIGTARRTIDIAVRNVFRSGFHVEQRLDWLEVVLH
jgi:hypothetical protein